MDACREAWTALESMRHASKQFWLILFVVSVCFWSYCTFFELVQWPCPSSFSERDPSRKMCNDIMFKQRHQFLNIFLKQCLHWRGSGGCSSELSGPWRCPREFTLITVYAQAWYFVTPTLVSSMQNGRVFPFFVLHFIITIQNAPPMPRSPLSSVWPQPSSMTSAQYDPEWPSAQCDLSPVLPQPSVTVTSAQYCLSPVWSQPSMTSTQYDFSTVWPQPRWSRLNDQMDRLNKLLFGVSRWGNVFLRPIGEKSVVPK